MAAALGGDCAADVAVFRTQPGVFELVTSDPTVCDQRTEHPPDCPVAVFKRLLRSGDPGDCRGAGAASARELARWIRGPDWPRRLLLYGLGKIAVSRVPKIRDCRPLYNRGNCYALSVPERHRTGQVPTTFSQISA